MSDHNEQAALDSEEIVPVPGDGPPYRFHEEWAHHARSALPPKEVKMTSSHSDECSVSSQAASRGGFVFELFLTTAILEALGRGHARAFQIVHRTGLVAETEAAAVALKDAVRHTLSRLERQGRVTYGYHGYSGFKTWKLTPNTSEESDGE